MKKVTNRGRRIRTTGLQGMNLASCQTAPSRIMPGHPGVYLEMSGGGTRYESAGGLLHQAAVSYGEVGGAEAFVSVRLPHDSILSRFIPTRTNIFKVLQKTSYSAANNCPP